MKCIINTDSNVSEAKEGAVLVLHGSVWEKESMDHLLTPHLKELNNKVKVLENALISLEKESKINYNNYKNTTSSEVNSIKKDVASFKHTTSKQILNMANLVEGVINK